MITRAQCRAARGLLGWTQQELADFSGLSKTSINNYERGLSDVKGDTLQAIHDAFATAQVAFIGHEGVQKKADTVNIFKGADSFFCLQDDIYETLQQEGGGLLVCGMSQAFEQKMTQVQPDRMQKHQERLESIGAQSRSLTKHGDHLYFSTPGSYRWIDEVLFSFGKFSFIYGNKVALKLWYDDMILIINSKQASDAERERFEKMWAQAETPPLADGRSTVENQERVKRT